VFLVRSAIAWVAFVGIVFLLVFIEKETGLPFNDFINFLLLLLYLFFMGMILHGVLRFSIQSWKFWIPILILMFYLFLHLRASILDPNYIGIFNPPPDY
jgi:hypothetical protein